MNSNKLKSFTEILVERGDWCLIESEDSNEIAEAISVLDEVAGLVREWRDAGRRGFCLPVIRGDLLRKLEQYVSN